MFKFISPPRPLTQDDGPLVWIDCEMTGLDVESDIIIEIAVIITNGDLQPVDEGIEFVIRTEKSVLDKMGEWCTDQHGRSGLTAACISSPHSYEDVKTTVLNYIKTWIPEKRIGVLAGSSVHADARFLMKGMPEIIDHLHYRIVDVSTIKELVRRWYPLESKQREQTHKYESAHRALDDIRASIAELERYRREVFVPSMATTTTETVTMPTSAATTSDLGMMVESVAMS